MIIFKIKCMEDHVCNSTCDGNSKSKVNYSFFSFSNSLYSYSTRLHPPCGVTNHLKTSRSIMALLAIISVLHTAQYCPLSWMFNVFLFFVYLQGFIEMEDKETASTFLNYYSHVTPTIRYSKSWLWDSLLMIFWIL